MRTITITRTTHPRMYQILDMAGCVDDTVTMEYDEDGMDQARLDAAEASLSRDEVEEWGRVWIEYDDDEDRPPDHGSPQNLQCWMNFLRDVLGVER